VRLFKKKLILFINIQTILVLAMNVYNTQLLAILKIDLDIIEIHKNSINYNFYLTKQKSNIVMDILGTRMV
jgi:hypothetical protein